MLIGYKDASQDAYGNAYKDAYTSAYRKPLRVHIRISYCQLKTDKGILLRIRKFIGMSIRMRNGCLYGCLWESPTVNRNANRISYCL